MSKIAQFMIFLKNFALGITIPVTNLILLAAGANLQTLPLLISLYSFTVIAMELPSGIGADLFGRKRIFLLACAFKLIYFLLIMVAPNYLWLAVAMICSGLGRAFSSGSIEALIIDETLGRMGPDFLGKVTGRLAVLEGSGLAFGGLVGGLLSNLTGDYRSNFFGSAVLTVMLLLVAEFTLHEQTAPVPIQHIPFRDHLRHGQKLISSTPSFAYLLLGGFFTGFVLNVIETYWQPSFAKIIAGQNRLWLLGVLTFCGFFAVTVGNIGVEKTRGKYGVGWWPTYHLLRLAFAASMVGLAFQHSTGGFILWYTLVYLCLGAANVAEATLINRMTPGALRASMLSLNSLLAQIGVLSAAFFSSLAIIMIQIRGVWLVAGGLVGGYALVVALRTKRNRAGVTPFTG